MTPLPPQPDREFKTGDRIVKTTTGAGYTVSDPPRTSAGKLRLRRDSGTIMTTWWDREKRLPKHYVMVRRCGA